MPLESSPCAIPEVLLLSCDRHQDSRGYFTETYLAAKFDQLGIGARFVQENQALSVNVETIRGLHFQSPPHAQAKLVRVLRGAIFDVAVDIRIGSPTYGKWVGTRLDAAGGDQIFVPAGFAHGYCTLEPDTEILYKCDAYYAPDAEGGILFSDPAIGIEWPVAGDRAILSEKDLALPRLEDLSSPFVMGAI